ncbi:MAG: hypothetical protein ACRCUJ_01575 [Phocaeicola sp.]
MSIPNFPSTGLVPNVTTFQVGDILYMWDGEKWKSITAPLKADQVTWKDGKTAGYALDDLGGFTAELLSQAGIVDDGGIDELGASQRVDAIKLLNKDASKVTIAGGGSVQDFIDAQYTTVSELATGKFQVGTYVRLIDREMGLFLLKDGNTADGKGILHAGENKIAELNTSNGEMVLEHIGAKGDLSQDESSYFNYIADFLAASDGRKAYTMHGKLYKLSLPVVMDLGNKKLSQFIMNSPIVPDDGIGDAVLIKNHRNSTLKLMVSGGGQSGALVNYALADPLGAQQAFVLRGMRECDIEVIGLAYRGRVLRTKATDSTIKTSFNSFKIRTGDREGAEVNARCGQSWYLQGDDSAFGSIDSAWIPWDEYGSVSENLTDITTGNIEFGADLNNGMQWLGINSGHFGVFAGGDETFMNTVLKFGPSTTQDCISVDIDRIFALRGNVGVEFVGSGGSASGTRKNYNVKSICTKNNSTVGVSLNGVNGSKFNIDSSNDAVALLLSGVIRSTDIHIKASGSINSPIKAASDANIASTYINGKAFGNSGAPTVDFSAAAAVGVVVFDGFDNVAPNVAYSLPASNGTKIFNGSIDLQGTGTAFPVGKPLTIKDCEGYKTEANGIAVIPIGQTSIVVNHTLATIPNNITLNNQTDFNAIKGPTSITATTFTITLESVTTVLTSVMWNAQIKYR